MHGRILITGGAGFLGRAILRAARREGWDAEFTVYSRDELKQSLCKRRYRDVHYVLGDVRDEDRLRAVMVGHDIVLHAGALKYVPEGEYNVSECISVNVGGTQTVLQSAQWSDVQQVVVVSTDKAVQPVNVYGATKMLAERLVGEGVRFGDWGGTKVTAVRYGNVVGSTGSVIPEFERQVRETGSVTITDPDMTRFWLGAGAAVDLIGEALSDRILPGSIVIPNPRARSMRFVAEVLAGEANVNIVGPRPGEKKHELLLTRDESRRTHTHSNGIHELTAVNYVDPGRIAPTPFQLSSETADHMTDEELRELVEDAHDI